MKLLKGLRGKLILTYTLVTVLALLALETIIAVAGVTVSGLTDDDLYVGDIVTTLVPGARSFLQPGEEDLSGLQLWLENQARTGYASLEPQDIFDSPAAEIVSGSTLYVLDPRLTILAQTPLSGGDLRGQEFSAPGVSDSKAILEYAVNGNEQISNLYSQLTTGDYWVAVPVFQKDHDLPVLGVIVVQVKPLPVRAAQTWLYIFVVIMITGVLLMLALAPFGAVFGWVMSRGLTRRLSGLAAAADRYAGGDFENLPVDRSDDEIGHLSRRMRNMAESIQVLLQDKQALAQMKERNRIAQELHDTVKQQSFATLMQVRAARNQMQNDPAAAQQSLLEAEKLIKASQQELGLMISELRPPELEGKGLASALETYLESWSKNACIPSTFKASGERPLPIELERALYRVAQEALANVARHSRASEVVARLSYDGQLVRLEIEDNGVGFNPKAMPESGFGIESMRQRLEEVNGVLRIFTRPDGGTRVTAEVQG